MFGNSLTDGWSIHKAFVAVAGCTGLIPGVAIRSALWNGFECLIYFSGFWTDLSNVAVPADLPESGPCFALCMIHVRMHLLSIDY